MFLFSSERVTNTNPRCIIKPEVVDNCEPTIAVTLGRLVTNCSWNKITKIFSALDQGKNILFKTENLDTLELLQQFNKIVLPLVPKEEEIVGKVAGKIAAKASGKAAGKAPIRKK